MIIPDLPAPRRPVLDHVNSSRIREVFDVGRHVPGLIPLWFGESDQPTPPPIVTAAIEALKANDTFYVPNAGIPELRETLATYMSALHGRPIDANRVVVTASGMNAIVLTIQALVGAGDSAVILGPVWPNIREAAIVAGGDARQIDLVSTADGGFRLDLDRLFGACDATTRLIFVNSPSNPTGWAASPEEIAAILAFARERGIWVVADEVYGRMVYDGEKAPSFLDQASPDDPLIVVNSFSKSWAMTGWRLGWLTLPAPLEKVISTLQEFNLSCATSFVQRAAVVAVREGEPYLQAARAQLAQARELVMQRLGGLRRVRLARPQAAFYAFPQIEGMADSLAFAQDLARQARVGVAPGSAFGPGGEGRLRICYAASLPRLSEALDRLAPHLD